MKIWMLLFLFFIAATDSICQNRNSVWCFGDSAGIDFSSGAPVAFSTGMDGRGSCTNIADSNGNLLFYAFPRVGFVGPTSDVFDSSNQLMQNGDSVVGEGWYNELTIVPVPNTSNQYYLFCTGEDLPYKGLFYSVIDMSQNGGLGAVIQKNIQINIIRTADCVQAIKHGNGRDWWVLSKFSNNTTFHNRFYVYLISPSGISAPTIQNLQSSQDCDSQKFIFNPEGTKLMLINQRGFMSQYDFDRCTGIISNPNIIYSEQSGPYTRIFQEGAYSPDGSKFYLSSIWYYAPDSDTSWVLQYDLTASNIAATSDTLFYIRHPAIGGAMRLAPDGKIYYTCGYDSGVPNGYPYPDSVRNIYNENLGVINYPDSVGTACDFQPFSFNLGGKRTYWGLPNNTNYELGALAGSICDTLTGVSPTPALPGGEGVLYVYYHPAWQKAFINAKGLKGRNVKMSVVDVLGNVVYSEEATSLPFGEGQGGAYFTKDLNCAAFAKGMYIVNLVTDKERLVKKFVKD